MNDESVIQENPRPPRTLWLLIFTDLLSLMLTFFVLLFAMSEVKMESWRAVVEALSREPYPAELGEQPKRPESNTNPATATTSRSVDLGYLQAVLTEKLGNQPLVQAGALRRLGDRLILSLPADGLFEEGDAVLRESSVDATRMLADMLQTIRNRIEIQGHVRPDVKHDPKFRSNWELSLAQAGMLARALTENGFDRDIPAFGFADSRFYDLAPGLAPERRHALAHRVDLVIHEPEG